MPDLKLKFVVLNLHHFVTAPWWTFTKLSLISWPSAAHYELVTISMDRAGLLTDPYLNRAI